MKRPVRPEPDRAFDPRAAIQGPHSAGTGLWLLSLTLRRQKPEAHKAKLSPPALTQRVRQPLSSLGPTAKL